MRNDDALLLWPRLHKHRADAFLPFWAICSAGDHPVGLVEMAVLEAERN